MNIAETDSLTGLMNRMKCEQLLRNFIDESLHDNNKFLIMLIDIDRFKLINDTYGHSQGDQVLREFSQLLTSTLRKEDYSGRWGGDEFIVIIKNIGLEEGMAIADKINHNVTSGIQLPNLEVTLSIGLKSYAEGESLSELIVNTDLALYEAKRKGRNRHHTYEQLVNEA